MRKMLKVIIVSSLLLTPTMFTVNAADLNLPGFTGTINTTIVQTLVEENFRGRIMSMQQWAWGSAALGGIFTGFFAQNFGAPKTLILSGILIIFSAIFIGSLLLKFIKNR